MTPGWAAPPLGGIRVRGGGLGAAERWDDTTGKSPAMGSDPRTAGALRGSTRRFDRRERAFAVLARADGFVD